MARYNTAINAVSGKEIVSGFTDAQFDRWIDHHSSDYRYAREIEEVTPELRLMFKHANDRTHFLIPL